jgi:hypothetical protein
VVHSDDFGGIANPADGHRLGESSRRRNLRRHGIVQIHNVLGPVDVDCTRNVAGKVFVGSAAIRGFFDARRNGLRGHVTSHVDHADVRIVQVLRQPVRAHKRVVGHGSVPDRFSEVSSLR